MKAIRISACIAIMLLASSILLAQSQQTTRKKQSKATRNGAVVILTSVPVKALDYLVALTPDQATKIASIQEKFRADEKALRKSGASKMPGITPNIDPATRSEINDLRAQAAADISAVLTEPQKVKLRESAQEIQSVRAVGIPLELLGELKLTDSQKTEFAKLTVEVKAKLKELKPLAPDLRRTQTLEIAKEFRQKAEALLTDDQKKVLIKYKDEHQKKGRKNNKLNK